MLTNEPAIREIHIKRLTYGGHQLLVSKPGVQSHVICHEYRGHSRFFGPRVVCTQDIDVHSCHCLSIVSGRFRTDLPDLPFRVVDHH